MRVWGDTCKAYDQGEEAALWLSAFLGEVRIVAYVYSWSVCVNFR